MQISCVDTYESKLKSSIFTSDFQGQQQVWLKTVTTRTCFSCGLQARLQEPPMNPQRKSIACQSKIYLSTAVSMQPGRQISTAPAFGSRPAAANCQDFPGSTGRSIAADSLPAGQTCFWQGPPHHQIGPPASSNVAQ